MTNINFRVFRRNNRNLIILWNSAHLTEDQRDSITSYSVVADGMGDEKELKWSKFVPDNPEKFAPDVDGIVIAHSPNGMNPAEPCTVKVIFGTGDDSIEMVKDVLPANSVAEPAKIARVSESGNALSVHLYAMNYATNAWVPWPHDGKLPDNIKLVISDK